MPTTHRDGRVFVREASSEDLLGEIAPPRGAKRADPDHPVIRHCQKADRDVLLASFAADEVVNAGCRPLGHSVMIANKERLSGLPQSPKFRKPQNRGRKDPNKLMRQL